MFGRWVTRNDVPRAVYVDRHSIHHSTVYPEEPTQFSRAMQALQVKLVPAHSPQAKGRVERRNAVF